MSRIYDVMQMELYAWVGEDDADGTNELGLKQGIVPAGIIPLVAVKREKMDSLSITKQMDMLAKSTGKTRYLVRFKAEEVVLMTRKGKAG